MTGGQAILHDCSVLRLGMPTALELLDSPLLSHFDSDLEVMDARKEGEMAGEFAACFPAAGPTDRIGCAIVLSCSRCRNGRREEV